jgi:DNA-binding PadR family transcriptional regulator
MGVSKDLVAASGTPLVLSILAEGESYGYAIIKRVGELSGGQMAWTDGMLYPVLHRLEKQGLIESSVRRSEAGRKRKYYRLKKEGTKVLNEHKSEWKMVYSTLGRLWEVQSCLT